MDEKETIRRMHFIQRHGIQEIARELNHSRKTVRKAIADAAVPQYHLTRARQCPVMDPFKAIIEFVPFTKEGAEALFTFCSSGYERGSMIITTNLDFVRWKEIFGDEALTGALLDRLTHRSHILGMNGDSYRFKESLRRKKKDVN